MINVRKAVSQITYELFAFVEFARYWHRIEGIRVRRLVILSPLAVLVNWILPGWAGQDMEFGRPWSRRHSLFLAVAKEWPKRLC